MRGTARIRIPQAPSVNLPDLPSLADGDTTSFETGIDNLIDQCTFLQARVKMDLEARTQAVTFFENGTAMSQDKVVHLFYRGTEPRPFDICLEHMTLASLARWLKTVKSFEEDAVGPVRVSLVEHNNCQYAFFRSNTRQHGLWLRTVERPFLREMVEIPASCPPEFAVRVDAQALRGWANFHASMRRHLICWVDFEQSHASCYLCLLEDAEDLPARDLSNASRIPAIAASSLSSSPTSAPPPIRFSATALTAALGRLKGSEVDVFWRLGANSISLRDSFGEESLLMPTAKETFLRVSRR